jgi:bifunctional non-homologous end joining protein LigD
MAARVVQELPEGDQWLYEVKWDGYRALLLKDGDRVQIRSRNKKDLTATYPTVAAGAARLRAESAVVDGEIVAVDPTGPRFRRCSIGARSPGTRSRSTRSISCTSTRGSNGVSLAQMLESIGRRS